MKKLSRADKIWELYQRTNQDMETLKHFCRDNPQAMKQIGFLDTDILRLRDEGLK